MNERAKSDKTFISKLRNNFIETYQSGDYDKALSITEAILDFTPDDPLAWYNKGIVLVRLSQCHEAVEAFVDHQFRKILNNSFIMPILAKFSEYHFRNYGYNVNFNQLLCFDSLIFSQTWKISLFFIGVL
jgi:tetratricopeptide (TPR) repeat protein